MKVYISGKITGNESEAPALFGKAETHLILLGNDVINPMDLPHAHDKSWESYMKEDLIAMLKCDAIFMLTGWRKSRGARMEYNIARQMKLKIIFQKK